MENINSHEYFNLLEKIKVEVIESQRRATMAVNSRMTFAYWQIGTNILIEQQKQGWGARVIDQLANDLTFSFPDMKGFSRRNLIYMQKFAQNWPIDLIVQQPAAQLQTPSKQQDIIVQQPAAQFENFEKHPISRVPWSHHMLLLDKFENVEIRLFYCHKIIDNNWSRKVLLNQLDRNLHLQQGALSNNFDSTLSSPQADLVKATFKDPYFFDFLKLGDEASELEIEKKLVRQISDFLLELGAGFAYMGRQFKLEVGGQEFRLDLLFYHTKLRSFVNIELKIDEFKPEHIGKSQFYLTVINDLVKSSYDNPTIGIILCKGANRVVVEYALKENNVPIGIAEYRLTAELPDEMKGILPSLEQFERSLRAEN